MSFLTAFFLGRSSGLYEIGAQGALWQGETLLCQHDKNWWCAHVAIVSLGRIKAKSISSTQIHCEAVPLGELFVLTDHLVRRAQ